MANTRVKSARYPDWMVRSMPPLLLSSWGLAILLSTVQVYWRHALDGRSPGLGETLTANLVAWLPWLALAPLTLWLARRFPLQPGKAHKWNHLVIHLLAASFMAAAFVSYLTGFRFLYLQDVGSPLNWSSFSSIYVEEAGAHYLAGVLLYGAILAAALGSRMLRKPPQAPAPVEHTGDLLIERSVGRVQMVSADKIDWIEASGNYVTLHTGDRSTLLRRTLTSLEKELAGRGFVRVHRSTLVSIRRIIELRPASHGEAWVILTNGRRLKVSRTYRGQLRKLLA